MPMEWTPADAALSSRLKSAFVEALNLAELQ
jgi:hypothetical protein